MAAPTFVRNILGWRPQGTANIADRKQATSVAIADELLRALRVRRQSKDPPQTLGDRLEAVLMQDLSLEIPRRDPVPEWTFARGGAIAHYNQYEHLGRLQHLVDADPTLRAEVGVDYLIKPDLTVGIKRPNVALPVLHAVVSTKFTIRSDRVQNIRQEALVLIRHRRGRQPHIAVATLEPLPTRILSIARGTGEVDCVYHLALDELQIATAKAGTAKQRAALDELVTQNRLRGYDALLDELTAR